MAIKEAGKPKKIVYLLGAGATHAELVNISPEDIGDETFSKKKGLLISNVSDRVLSKVRRDVLFSDIKNVLGTGGLINFELLISLIEESKIPNLEKRVLKIKSLVEKDINRVLTKEVKRKFYLHKALLELHDHKKVKEDEELSGILSLNYDDVIDKAYQAVFPNQQPSFFLSHNEITTDGYPLLKLHGSFNWKDITVNGRKKSIETIPLGMRKNFLYIPYIFIWTKALQILIDCDILRVIGSRFSENDTHLIDLIFKAHLERKKDIEIQLITSDSTGTEIKKNYGFFPNIKTLLEIEVPLIPIPKVDNVFKEWLSRKASKMLNSQTIKHTKYLKRLVKINLNQ